VNFREMTQLAQAQHVSPEQAADAIATLRAVEDRLAKADGALARHLSWAREAVWAAAYPDDPSTMLENVSDMAEQVG
jgi:hypothetical protein